MTVTTPLIGAPIDRIEGAEKVRGAALYAAEHPVDQPVYVFPLQSEIALGRITGIDKIGRAHV